MKVATIPFNAPIKGDFAALFAQLDTPSETATVAGGYAALLARVSSADYRKRCGLISH